jgi:integrase/recombinase XerD
MPRKPKPPRPDLGDPQGMVALMQQFFESLRVRNYSEGTVTVRRLQLTKFVAWLADRGIAQPREVTKPIIERYQRYLYHYRSPKGKALSFQTQNGRIVGVRAWFKWLARHNHVLYNPAADLELNRAEHRLPKCVMTASEAEQVISQTDVGTPLGVRDRAILETFYSTGMRRTELMNLCPCDFDMERGTVVIRQGKGKKDRMVPVGDRAIAWVDRYEVEVRPRLLVGDRAGDVLFVTDLGKPFRPEQMSELVAGYVKAADIGKEGSCHLFRHTMATLMMENGASLRYIQAILGHASLETTQVYTRVSIRRLKEVHTKTHPARKNRTRDG